jgi:hypothetical protein
MSISFGERCYDYTVGEGGGGRRGGGGAEFAA